LLLFLLPLFDMLSGSPPAAVEEFASLQRQAHDAGDSGDKRVRLQAIRASWLKTSTTSHNRNLF